MTLISVYYVYNYELWGVLQRPKSENTFKNQVKHGQLQKDDNATDVTFLVRYRFLHQLFPKVYKEYNKTEQFRLENENQTGQLPSKRKNQINANSCAGWQFYSSFFLFFEIQKKKKTRGLKRESKKSSSVE